MNSNVGGILVLAVAVFIIGMGIFGSQHDLFPWLFGAGVDTSGLFGSKPSATPVPTNVPGLQITNTDPSGNCDITKGWIPGVVSGGKIVCWKA